MCVKGKDLREYNSALGGDHPLGQVAVPEQRHEPHAGGAMARQGMVVEFDLGVLFLLVFKRVVANCLPIAKAFGSGVSIYSLCKKP